MKGILMIFLVLSLWKSEANEFILSCNYSYPRTTYSDYGYENPYECTATNLLELIGEIKVDKASGIHQINPMVKKLESEETVVVLNITGATSLTKIPSNIQKVFKNIIILDIEYSDIKVIHEADLSPLTTLKIIILPNNKIAAISSDLFKNYQTIEGIDLSNNSISSINRDTFDNLMNLKVLKLQNNLCSNIKKPAMQLQEVQNLVIAIEMDGCVPEKVTTTTQTSTSTTTKKTISTETSTISETTVETTPKTAAKTTENQKDVEIRDQSKQIDELSKQINSTNNQKQIFVIINQEVSQDNGKN